MGVVPNDAVGAGDATRAPGLPRQRPLPPVLPLLLGLLRAVQPPFLEHFAPQPLEPAEVGVGAAMVMAMAGTSELLCERP